MSLKPPIVNQTMIATPDTRMSHVHPCQKDSHVLPGGSREHEIEGRVVWSHEPAAGGAPAPGMGVTFTDPIAAEQLALELDALC